MDALKYEIISRIEQNISLAFRFAYSWVNTTNKFHISNIKIIIITKLLFSGSNTKETFLSVPVLRIVFLGGNQPSVYDRDYVWLISSRFAAGS